MEKIELKAYGKINLGLDVIRKRPDGYHDLDMIMQMVDVYDDIVITKNKT
jgi:4-diphosphocytidyl-2-C-methyl-D-erythritol kinase